MVLGELEKSWHDRYERWAAKYREDHLIAGWSPEGLSRRLALVLHVIEGLRLKPKSFVLDLGAGAGTYTRAMNNIGHTCLGLDYSKRVIEAARKKGREEIYIQGEAYNLPFRANAFDAVLCVGVLQSLACPVQALREIERVLVPGGHLLLDGLNSLFWRHRLRSWKEGLNGAKTRMNYVDPYCIDKEAESMGFSGGKIYWLTAPRILAGWCVSRGLSGLVVARLLGHAFLLHERKSPSADGISEKARDSQKA